jgi:hypothetical protein
VYSGELSRGLRREGEQSGAVRRETRVFAIVDEPPCFFCETNLTFSARGSVAEESVVAKSSLTVEVVLAPFPAAAIALLAPFPPATRRRGLLPLPL